MKLQQSFMLVFVSSILCVSNAMADSFKCVGMDGDGNKIHVLYDEDTKTVNINGNILKIESGTVGENGIATENYKTEDDGEVYASLVVEDKNSIVLRQFNAEDDKELAVVPLACE